VREAASMTAQLTFKDIIHSLHMRCTFHNKVKMLAYAAALTPLAVLAHLLDWATYALAAASAPLLLFAVKCALSKHKCFS